MHKKDRHLNTEARKEHDNKRKEHNKKDRHLDTEERKEHNKKDRHLDTEARKEHNKGDRHLNKQDRHSAKYFQDRYTESKKQQMLSDTGMDLICASCVEWKSATSCVHISKLPIEKIFKYCTETELTKNSDGQFYCCITCKMSINDDKQPRRSQKEILGLLDFPKEFMDYLETH